MKLVLMTKKKKINLHDDDDDDDLKDEYFIKIEEIEIIEFRWDEKHIFSFVRKGFAHYEYLEDYQEIFRLTD